MGETTHAYYAECEFAGHGRFETATRSDEFMATGKDAYKRGLPQPTVEFIEIPTHGCPGRVLARRRGPDDHAQPPRQAQRLHRAPCTTGCARRSKAAAAPGGARGRDHGRGPRLLGRPGPDGVWRGKATSALCLRATYHVNINLPIRSLEKPVIAAVNGVLRRRGPLARVRLRHPHRPRTRRFFVPGFIDLGLVPDGGGSWFVQRLLGASRAFEWMTRPPPDRGRGRRRGGSSPRSSSRTRSRRGSPSSPRPPPPVPTCAIGLTKRLFDEAEARTTLEQQLALEAELQTEAAPTADFSEGLTAFAEKRGGLELQRALGQGHPSSAAGQRSLRCFEQRTSPLATDVELAPARAGGGANAGPLISAARLAARSLYPLQTGQ